MWKWLKTLSWHHRTSRVIESLLNFYENWSSVEWGSVELLEREEKPKARSGAIEILCNFAFVRLLNEEEKANTSRRMIHKRRTWENFLRKLSVKNSNRLQFAGYHRFVHTVGTRISLPWNHINFLSQSEKKANFSNSFIVVLHQGMLEKRKCRGEFH